MDNIFIVFIVQAILCVVLFAFIYYFVKKNAELKGEIELLKENLKKGERQLNVP